MLKLLSRFSNRLKASQRPERVDAMVIYRKVMKQSRNPVFYRPGLIEDTTDGRMEWLTAHLSIILHALNRHGSDGATLSQAIYDTMVDDFDVALREEGLSDSGVKHRIKPLAKMFLSRARVYSDALNEEEKSLDASIQKYVLQEREANNESEMLAKYLRAFSANVRELKLDQIAKAGFNIPDFS
ncbi:MAG: hypothetical protein EX271_05275 [Acidimicrobiales bacterium]|nr:hypothetical protein [Hyphomonadaceae bacterium]RZV42738.1 MAG: hypothetical protein EX271_05275 [Acidimicrobiales bacterium]